MTPQADLERAAGPLGFQVTAHGSYPADRRPRSTASSATAPMPTTSTRSGGESDGPEVRATRPRREGLGQEAIRCVMLERSVRKPIPYSKWAD
jgi:hypothetical protein